MYNLHGQYPLPLHRQNVCNNINDVHPESTSTIILLLLCSGQSTIVSLQGIHDVNYTINI